MPSLDTIRTLTIKATTDGVDDATKSLNDLAAAQGGVAVASDTSTKSTLSASSALNKLQNSLDPSYRSATQLNAAQTTLGKSFDQGLLSVDRYNQLMQLSAQRFDDAGKKANPFTVALSGVKTQMVALSAGLGPLGTGLAAFGPIGLAIGVGIGAVVAGFDALEAQANEAGKWATTLQQASAIIGLNTTQIQALNEAAAQVGVSANDNVSAFEKFSVALGQLKDGSGTLYTELLKVNPALVSQLSVTKDSTTAWNLLAQAYASANAQQQALITRASFGRGGAAEGQVLQATANAGGIGNLSTADTISQSQIKQWADLTTQINSATEAAQHNFQSIFTTDILTGEKSFADGMLKISQAAREFAMSDDLKAIVGFFANPIVAGTIGGAVIGAVGGAFFGGVGAIPGAIAGGVAGGVAGATVSGISGLGASSRSALPPAPNFDATFGAVNSSNSATSSNQVAASLGVQATQAKALVSALGGAATAQDKLDSTTKQLNLDLANGKITQDTYSRALAGANLDAAISKQTLYNSTLGEFATTQDLVNAKTLSLQKAQQQGAGLTTTQITAVKNLTAANDEWTRVTGQSQIGVFNLSLATKAAGDQFQVWIDKKYLDPSNPTQYAAALQAMANKIQATADAAKVAGSAFPQLAQLGVDAANTNKQFDTFATTSLNDFSDALVSIRTNASTAAAAFTNFGLQVLAALEKMIIQLTIIKPLAAAVEGSFGGTGGFLSALGLGGASAAGAASQASSATTLANNTGGAFFGPGFHTGGIVGAEPTFMRYIHPAYFDDAPRFHGGGIAGNEVPIIAQKGEGVFTQGQMAALGRQSMPQITVNLNESPNAQGTVTQKQNSNGGIDLDVAIAQITAKSATTSGSPLNKVLRTQLGAKQRLDTTSNG